MQATCCEHPHCTRAAEWMLDSSITALPQNLCGQHYETIRNTVPRWAAMYKPIRHTEPVWANVKSA